MRIRRLKIPRTASVHIETRDNNNKYRPNKKKKKKERKRVEKREMMMLIYGTNRELANVHHKLRIGKKENDRLKLPAVPHTVCVSRYLFIEALWPIEFLKLGRKNTK